MTALNWVWPPLMLALAVWMFVQMRRSVTGAGRWLLTPVIAVLALASIGATYENIARHRDQAHLRRPREAATTSAATGCTWTATATAAPPSCSPTASARSPPPGPGSPARSPRPPGSAPTTAPDRAGATTPRAPRTASQSAEDLHTLLAAAGEHGPYVLVGHSTGGTYAMTYAARYPEQVAGMVLLDSSSPEQFTRMPAYPGQYAVMRRGLRAAAHAEPPRPGPAGPRHLPPAGRRRREGQRDHLHARSTTGTSATRSRSSPRSSPRPRRSPRSATGRSPCSPPPRPAPGPTAGPAPRTSSPRCRPTRVHRTVDSTHAGLLEDVRPAAESVRAITEVISSVRTGTPLASR